MAFNLKWSIAGGLLVACGMIGAAAIVLRLPGWRTTDFLVAEIRSNLEQADHDLALPYLRELAGVGDQGVAEVVSLLGDARPYVASAARTALFERLDRWRLLKPAEASRRVAHLIASLNSAGQHFNTQARQDAARLATEVLIWPVDQKSIDVGKLVAGCERLLRQVEPVVRVAATPANSDDAEHAGGNQTTRTLTEIRLLEPDAAIVSAPGGELPLEVVALPSLPASVVREKTPRRTTNTAAKQAEPLQLELGRTRPQPLNPPPAILDPPQLMKPLQPLGASKNKAERNNRRGEIAPMAAAQLVSDMGELQIMRLLHDADNAVAGRAAAELRRRGFNTSQLFLAKHMTSPNEQERLDFANQLPQLAGVDIRPWLLWLSLDESVPVRATAVGLMATSADPQLLRQVREMARTERDAGILRTIRRVGGRSP